MSSLRKATLLILHVNPTSQVWMASRTMTAPRPAELHGSSIRPYPTSDSAGHIGLRAGRAVPLPAQKLLRTADIPSKPLPVA